MYNIYIYIKEESEVVQVFVCVMKAYIQLLQITTHH